MANNNHIDRDKQLDSIRRIVQSISEHDDRFAFKELFNIYYPKLLNYAFYILESRSDADEVVSMIFVKIWDQRKKISDIKNLDGYLYISIKNLCYNYIRDNKIFLFETLDSEECKVITSFENPENNFLESELREKVLEAIEELPPRCKLIFRMVREDGLKYNDVAKLLKLSVKTVEVQMGRAYSKMRSALIPFVQNHDIRSPLKVLRDTKTG
ncbi:RNA polymerase sigma-70 factor [Reichenbachiella sp. MALMAid0571]|uniref:RNA polymerase sigma-70 factor n=1 Tax=Reichenbachiella sp. MALMAid0571 TaxID=3143939 RepID=UPI0032DF86B2